MKINRKIFRTGVSMRKVLFKKLLILGIIGLFYFSTGMFAQRDIYGHGSAKWGDSKNTIRGRFSGKLKTGAVTIKETKYQQIVYYRNAKIDRKVYSYSGKPANLFKVTIYYHNPSPIGGTLNRKYGRFSKKVQGVNQWIFPSTIIKYEPGSRKSVFIDSSYKPQKKLTQKGGLNIDKVKIGMTMKEVQTIMGNPIAQTKINKNTYAFEFTTGTVFFKDDKVISIKKKDVTKGTVKTLKIRKK
ncbi:SmpA / OmlA family protein [Candidatus Methanomarinus sp.]|nr:SmpA / OmlA family protein [ANME-2 cluster archaeon]